MKLAIVAGARPNFMKIAPILHALRGKEHIRVTLIHTGQHYDANLSDIFFQQLDIQPPDVSLGVGAGSHAQQTSKIMVGIESTLRDAQQTGDPFDRLVVVGDVNSTMASAIAAAKLDVPVSHVEAGLRSFDRTMPEEINRIITDAISDQLLVSEPAGIENLKREGHSEDSMHLVGNVMIDTLLRLLPNAKNTRVIEQYGFRENEYVVVTLHRPSNVDCATTLRSILSVLAKVSKNIPVAFPIHPRTTASIERFDLGHLIDEAPGILRLPPLGYLEFLALTSSSKVIVTDSGGLQEESTALGIPCLTMRENTERPVTINEGTSTLVGTDTKALAEQLDLVLTGQYKQGRCPEIWDGKAAQRIVELWM